MRLIIPVVFVSSLGIGSMSASTSSALSANAYASSSSCADILRDGIFSQHVILQDKSTADVFRRWQCSVDFEMHEQAVDAGLAVGLPLFGVPLKIGGSFSRQQKDTWKSQNCSDAERKSQSRDLYFEMRRVADPAIVSAWLACQGMDRLGLRCVLHPLYGTADLAYLPTHDGDNGAEVISMSADNLTCTPPPKPGSSLTAGLTRTRCTNEKPERHGALDIQTSKGACTVMFPPRCGVVGSPCCGDGACAGAASCVQGQCERCGGAGEACCGDACNAGTSCSAERLCRPCTIAWYADRDGDGHGAGEPTHACVAPGKGFVAKSDDCDDADANVHPGQTEFFKKPARGGGFDYDCNGSHEKRWTNKGKCNHECLRAHVGWKSRIPKCGEESDWLDDCDRGCGLLLRMEYSDRVQACR